MKLPAGDLYVSSVEGHIVGRPGSGTPAMKPQWIGAYAKTVTKPDGSTEFEGVVWRTDEVHRIPVAEVQNHFKAWQLEIAGGGLKLRTKADYEAYLAKQLADSTAEAKAIEDEAKARADAAKAGAKALADAAAKEAAKAAKATPATPNGSES